MEQKNLRLSAGAWRLLQSLQDHPENYLKDKVVQTQWRDEDRQALQELIEAGLVEETKAYRLTNQ